MDNNDRGHAEARWVAFTQRAGWNVTLREGATTEDIDDLANLLLHADRVLGRSTDIVVKGSPTESSPRATATRGTNQAAPVQPKPAETARGASAGGGHNDANDNPRQVSRVVVSGTKAAPKVECFSPNAKLKFPIFVIPFSILHAILDARYPEQEGWNLKQFSDIGEEYSVDWEVYWEPSPKDAKYRDVTDIVEKGWEGGK
jgi:hypothetical protein